LNISEASNLGLLLAFEQLLVIYIVALLAFALLFGRYVFFERTRMVEKVNRTRKLFDLAIFTQLLRIVSNESYVNALEEMILAEKLGVFDNDKAAKVSSKVVKDVTKEIRGLFRVFSARTSLEKNWKTLNKYSIQGMIVSFLALSTSVFALIVLILSDGQNASVYLSAGFSIALGAVAMYYYVRSFRSYAIVRSLVRESTVKFYRVYIDYVNHRSSDRKGRS